MLTEQKVTLGLGILMILCPFFLVFFIYKFYRANGFRKTAQSALEEVRENLRATKESFEKVATENTAFVAIMKKIEDRYKPIMDLDKEAETVQSSIDAMNGDLLELRFSYAEKKVIYDHLIKEVAVFDEKIAFAEMGVYEPHFEFNDSEEYKRNIEVVRASQKAMVTAKTAVVCPTAWTVDGSTAKGQTMTNRNIKLTLRACNNECDAAVANTRWSNVNAMEKRIGNAFTQINKLNESNRVFITEEYLKLRYQELFLTHEYREKLKAEREERAEMARAAKEEQKFIRDMERAEEDEARYQRLLNKAKAEAELAVGPKLHAFNEQIAILERDLAQAHAKFERAQAMAEKTRSGYVYIISNVGSFGADVVKIGLTRRLDPADRIRELGDASVPFVFDTHAIIYSDDAPTLERALHLKFEPVRVNAQNYRKEFFKATLDDVESAVKRLAPDAPFFKDIEAQDYRETLSKRNATLAALEVTNTYRLPEAI
ncbi:DUF4041 domain-containing protein [Agrobacterium rosae]|uniref:DUF4041 domain-containing protein n=1 Tax=Agrobacterium rosae TaxID=1972867 RepID=UPI001FEF8BAF|nr:DUF4041 domain-containing protein [Agrobacterium rosae]